jgi:subtilisin family serine protease
VIAMPLDALEKIYSNDYADFLIEYNDNLSVLQRYEQNAVNIIDFFLAVVHLPVSEMTEDVISKRGYSAIPSLFGLTGEESLEASGILRLRSIPSFNLKGSGVLIGIADTGIDYTNPIFQYADKTTRIAAIWDQSIASDKMPANMAYGTEYTREQINEALKNENPQSIVPSMDEIGHGTMVAGIAAGNEVVESDFYGVAPESELLIVKLKPAKPYLKQFFRLPENSIAYQENDIIFALKYLITYAANINKPLVICIAFDTSQYAHDGRGTTSRWLSLQASFPGNAVLIAVGNEGNARRHYMGFIDEKMEYDTVELNVGPKEVGFSMELWGTTPNIFSIDVLTPSGEYIPAIGLRLNETRELSFIFEPTVIFVDYQLVESQSGDQLILLRFSNPSPGIWKFNVRSRGLYPINYHIWLPMNDFLTADTFFTRSDPYTTLLSISCANTPITVTAYDTKDDSLYLNAGRGYTRIGLIKPDIAAPGVNILSPTLQHNFTPVTGTSAAVAHAAGVAAMLFEWGIVNGNYPDMSTVDMKIFMIRGAKRKSDIFYPNQDWGYGILDIYNVFDQIRVSV